MHSLFVRGVGDHKSYAAIFIPCDARRACYLIQSMVFPQLL